MATRYRSYVIEHRIDQAFQGRKMDAVGGAVALENNIAGVSVSGCEGPLGLANRRIAEKTFVQLGAEARTPEARALRIGFLRRWLTCDRRDGGRCLLQAISEESYCRHNGEPIDGVLGQWRRSRQAGASLLNRPRSNR